MQAITIQKKKLILKPLKIRQIDEIKAFIQAFSGEIDLGPGSEMSIMDAVGKVAAQGLLANLAAIIFPEQEAVDKIKWDDLDFNELAEVGDAFLKVNGPAIDALKRILMTSGLTAEARK